MVLRGAGQVNGLTNRFEYQNKESEKTFGLNRINLGARTYNPTIGRMDRVDNYADKYFGLSTFQYAANNPMRFIDVNGDSLNVSLIQKYDTQNSTNYLQTIINDLQSQTGLSYSVTSTGQLVYQKDGNGNAVIATTKDSNGNTVQAGSKEGRDIMTSNINNTTTVYARISTSNSSAPNGGTLINMNPNQINNFVNGANNVDSRTQGWGMTFMHESQHSILGGGLRDVPRGSGVGPIGPVETRMNIVRAELNANGANYGQRRSYESLVPPYSNDAYLPFDGSSLRALQNNTFININSKFIKYKP